MSKLGMAFKGSIPKWEVFYAGNIFGASLPPQSGSRILVYKGSPLPRMPTIKFREPLTDSESTPEPEQHSPAVTPKQAGRRSRARAQSSRFAAETGASI